MEESSWCYNWTAEEMDGIGLKLSFYKAAEERAATMWFTTHRSDLGELANLQPGTAPRGAIFAFQHNRQETHVSPDWLHLDYPLNTA